MLATFKKVFPYILIGVGIGAIIHNWIPEEWVASVLGSNNPFGVILATLIGVPMYADIFGTIPIAEALFYKGAQLGTVLSFMAAGILIGRFLPSIPAFLNQFEYAKVSIPVAILIWVMIYPMMMKVDFQSIKNVGKNPKGLYVTWITNWLIKPFTMST